MNSPQKALEETKAATSTKPVNQNEIPSIEEAEAPREGLGANSLPLKEGAPAGDTAPIPPPVAGETAATEPGAPAGAPAGERDNPHLSAEGALTLQAAGKPIAFFISKSTPNDLLLLKPSHKHSGFVLKTDFNPEQQLGCGLASVLPLVTKDKQSAMLITTLVQSVVGADPAVTNCTANNNAAITVRERILAPFTAIFMFVDSQRVCL